MRNIRGAFWGSVLNLIGFVMNIIIPGSGIFFNIIALAVSISEGDWISAISSVVSLGFADWAKAGSFFKGSFPGITNAFNSVGGFFSSIGNVFGTIFQPVLGFFKTAQGFLQGFLEGGLGTKIAAGLSNFVVSQAVSYGTSLGLRSLGVSPQIASFTGNLISGAVMVGIKGD